MLGLKALYYHIHLIQYFLKDDSFSNTDNTELIYSSVPLISVYLLEVISLHREKVYFCSVIEDSVLDRNGS